MRRWTLVPATVALAAVLANGCSSDTQATQPATTPHIIPAPTAGPRGVAAPVSKLVHAALGTVLVSSVHYTMRSTLHGDGQPAVVTVTGDADLARHVSRQDVRLSGGPVRLVHEVLTPQQVYYTSGNPATSRWSAVSRGDMLLQHLLRPPANDPAYPLVQAKLITKVVKKGVGSINGLDNVTHYAGVLPEVTMLQDAAPARRDHLAGFLAAMPHSETPIDVWIDKNGRVVRVTENVSAPGKGFSGTLTIDVSAYGISVNRAAPKNSRPVTLDAVPANVLG